MMYRAGIAILALAAAGCGDLVRQGTASSYLIVTQLEGASGAQPEEFGGTLGSDVLTVVDDVPTIFNDLARVTFQLGMKDPGPAGTPTTPTSNNFITVTRYRVRFTRSDGRNTQGVDVPYAFDGAFTVTVGDTASASFTVVRHQAKSEAPLAALRTGGFLSTIAEITFFARDQTGREVTASAFLSVNFGNFGDPE